MSQTSVDQIAAAIAQFEQSTNFRDFRKFHISQAVAFKDRLQRHINPETGRALAKATIHSRLMALKAFTIWLAGRPGYRSRIRYSDADYFNPSANDERIAKAVRTRPVPPLDDIRKALAAMPTDTVLERRDRAVVAFALVSGARDNAIASFSLKHIDLAARTVFQDAREVRPRTPRPSPQRSSRGEVTSRRLSPNGSASWRRKDLSRTIRCSRPPGWHRVPTAISWLWGWNVLTASQGGIRCALPIKPATRIWPVDKLPRPAPTKLTHFCK